MVDAMNWNEQAIRDAYAAEPPSNNSMNIFMAGKTLAEKECWKYVRERKPSFMFNAVLPDTVFGQILSPANQGIPSTAGLVRMLFKGQGLDVLQWIQPQYHCDCADVGRLHVAALLHPEAINERLLGYASRWNWNDILALFRKWFPSKTFPEDMELGRDISSVKDERSRKLLKDVYGQDNWVPLEQSIRSLVDSFINQTTNAESTVLGQLHSTNQSEI